MPYVEDYVNSLPQEHPMIHFSLSQGWQEQSDMKAKIQVRVDTLRSTITRCQFFCCTSMRCFAKSGRGNSKIRGKTNSRIFESDVALSSLYIRSIHGLLTGVYRIFRRLEVLGWGEELGFMQELGWDDLNSHPRLNEPKELTDKGTSRSWAT